MKKISEEEVQKLTFLKRGGNFNPVLNEMRKLEIGESFFYEKGDWTVKTDPTTAVANHGRLLGKRFSTRSLEDQTGWVSTRLS